MPVGNKTLTEAEAKKLQALLGPHTFSILVQQPTWNGLPLLNPAQAPLANNRPLPLPGSNPTTIAPPPEKHYVQTRQPGAGAAAAAPGQTLAPFEQVQKAALENMRQVAEAQVRLAASGIISIDTFDQQRKALEYLNGQGKKNEELDKRLGKNAATLRDAFAGVQKSMLLASATLAGTFAELRHFASAAQPGLWRAMDQSMTLLTAELGSALLPVTMSVTDSIMDLVDWFAGLDDGTKKLIAAGVIAVPATMALGHAVMALAPAAHLAKIGMKGLIAALGPVGATVTAIGVMAGGAAASVAAYNYFASQGQANPERHERAGERVTASELASVLKLTIHDVTEEDVRRVMAESPEQLRERAAALRQTAERTSDSAIARMLGSRGRRAELLESADVLERLAEQGGKSREEEDREKKEASLFRQARHYNAMITEAQRQQQPRYSPLEDARKQLQLGILGKSPIEQQLLQIQRKNIPKMVERLNSIMRELNEMNRRGRNQPG